MDPRLPADALVLLTYRASFVGNFRLHHVTVRKHLGIGKERFYEIVNLLKDLGYLTREQVPGNGEFGRSRESVDLACAPARRPGYRQHYRELFEQSLPAKSLGVYLYLAAFARTFAISSAQVQARFQWTRGMAGTHLRALIEAGFVVQQQTRDSSGRYNGTAYFARWPLSPGVPEPPAGKPDTAVREAGMPEMSARETGKPDTVARETGKPDAAAPETEKPDSYLASKQTDESKQTNNERRRRLKEEVVAPERDDVVDPSLADELARQLRSCDRAGALAAGLLTHRGLGPYCQMLRAHGEVARQVVADLLVRAAIDGTRPGKIRSWRYFASALADAVEANERAINGFDQDALQSSWRSKPLDPPF